MSPGLRIFIPSQLAEAAWRMSGWVVFLMPCRCAGRCKIRRQFRPSSKQRRQNPRCCRRRRTAPGGMVAGARRAASVRGRHGEFFLLGASAAARSCRSKSSTDSFAAAEPVEGKKRKELLLRVENPQEPERSSRLPARASKVDRYSRHHRHKTGEDHPAVGRKTGIERPSPPQSEEDIANTTARPSARRLLRSIPASSFVVVYGSSRARPHNFDFRTVPLVPASAARKR